jgi:hypothetical protein
VLVSIHYVDLCRMKTYQRRLVTDLSDPVRQLRVPKESVGTNELAVGRSEVHERVGIAESEGVAGCYGNDLMSVVCINING